VKTLPVEPGSSAGSAFEQQNKGCVLVPVWSYQDASSDTETSGGNHCARQLALRQETEERRILLF
jgi:hypothetical protein